MNQLGVSVRQGFLGSVTLPGTGCAVAFGAGLITDGRLNGTFSRCRAFRAGVFPAHPSVENHDQRSASGPLINDAALSVSSSYAISSPSIHASGGNANTSPWCKQSGPAGS
jgi:hypothetical protein